MPFEIKTNDQKYPNTEGYSKYAYRFNKSKINFQQKCMIFAFKEIKN